LLPSSGRFQNAAGVVGMSPEVGARQRPHERERERERESDKERCEMEGARGVVVALAGGGRRWLEGVVAVGAAEREREWNCRGTSAGRKKGSRILNPK